MEGVVEMITIDHKAILIQRIERYKWYLYTTLSITVGFWHVDFDTDEEIEKVKKEALKVLEKSNLREASRYAYKKLDGLRRKIEEKVGTEVPPCGYIYFITGYGR